MWRDVASLASKIETILLLLPRPNDAQGGGGVPTKYDGQTHADNKSRVSATKNEQRLAQFVH